MTKSQNNNYWIELPASKAIRSVGVIRLKETVLQTKTKWQRCLQFLQHTKERAAASIDLGNADAADSIFLENRFSPEDSNFLDQHLRQKSQ